MNGYWERSKLGALPEKNWVNWEEVFQHDLSADKDNPAKGKPLISTVFYIN